MSSFKGVTSGGTISVGAATAFSFPDSVSAWSTQEDQIVLYKLIAMLVLPQAILKAQILP